MPPSPGVPREELAELSRKGPRGQAWGRGSTLPSQSGIWTPTLLSPRTTGRSAPSPPPQLITGRLREDGEPVDVRARLRNAGFGHRVQKHHFILPLPHGPLQTLLQARPLMWPMSSPKPQSAGLPSPHKCPQGAGGQQAAGKRGGSRAQSWPFSAKVTELHEAWKGICKSRKQRPQAPGEAEKEASVSHSRPTV